MINILSTDSDSTTDIVMDWIDYFGHKVNRYNDSIFLNKKSFSILINNDETDRVTEMSNTVWFRKWNSDKIIEETAEDKNDLSVLSKENEVLNSFIFSEFEKKCKINKPIDKTVSKPIQLKFATISNLLIPESLITNSKSELIKFKEKFKNIISKPLSEPIFKFEEDKTYASYTHLLTDSDISELPDVFFPSFFQEYVEKKFELRIFFFNKKTYCMAIFSQSDEQTAIDFRHYNIKNPNRTIPFKLPENIENNLKIFMKDIDMNSGSIDICVNKKGEFIFLEVNPLGQFGMLSSSCNYFLEKKIAEYLIERYNEK